MIYVMSDIHGNRSAFHTICEQIDLQPADEIYILGDVIDRHPYGIEILREIMDMPHAHMLLGNHEYMMMDALKFPYEETKANQSISTSDLRKLWYWNGGGVTHHGWNQTPKNIQADIVDYLKALPLNIDLELNGQRWKLVHATATELYDIAGEGDDESRAHFSVWDRNTVFMLGQNKQYTVVFGHTPTVEFQKANPLKILYLENLIGIDCGAGWSEKSYGTHMGGRLACLRLDDRKEFYSRP